MTELMFGLPMDRVTPAAITAKQQAVAAALPISGRKPISLLIPTEKFADALPPASIDRLRRIKADRDPAGLFRGNFSASN